MNLKNGKRGKVMIVNIICLLVGSACGVMTMSCLSINSINEEREKAYKRGFEKGKHFGRMEERGRKRD